MTVAEMIRRLEGLKLNEAVVESLDGTKQSAADLNAKQLEEGNLSTGGRIQYLKDSHYPYTKQYARTKSKKGFQISVVDLSATSDKSFYKTEDISIEGDQITYQSNIKLGEYLEEMYGPQIWGLTDENKAAYTKEAFFPEFKRRIEEQTGLTFS